jgi:hypothetical protein
MDILIEEIRIEFELALVEFPHHSVLHEVVEGVIEGLEEIDILMDDPLGYTHYNASIALGHPRVEPYTNADRINTNIQRIIREFDDFPVFATPVFDDAMILCTEFINAVDDALDDLQYTRARAAARAA